MRLVKSLVALLRVKAVRLCLVTIASTQAVWAQSATEPPQMRPWFTKQDLSLEVPACRGAWDRKQFLMWLSDPGNRTWWPLSLTRALSKNETWAQEEARRLTGYFYPQPEDSPKWRGVGLFNYSSNEADSGPIPLTWMDFTGDGICDVIARSYDGDGMKKFNHVFLFRQTPKGFVLVNYSELGYEIDEGGEKPGALIPVYIRREPIPLLVTQQDLNLAGEMPAWLRQSTGRLQMNVLGRRDKGFKRDALRWNPQTLRFDLFSPFTSNDAANGVRAGGVMEIVDQFLQEHPERLKAYPCRSEMACEPPR